MKLLKEPLLHFLLIGAALFSIYGWRGNPAAIAGGPMNEAQTRIVISQSEVDQLNSQFAKTWQRSPTTEEQQALLEDFIRNEIYYREALAIGLDRDDAVLKRRLRQKMEFIYEDIGAMGEPTDADLKLFMSRHREKYLANPQVTFRQCYFNPDKRGKNAEADANRALAQLRSGGAPSEIGDPTMLASGMTLAPIHEISGQFGDEFGRRLLEMPAGKWNGPARSVYGVHLVFVDERKDGRLPDLQEIREAVRRDWTVERQRELKDEAYARIRERYAVTVDQPKTLALSAGVKGTAQ